MAKESNEFENLPPNLGSAGDFMKRGLKNEKIFAVNASSFTADWLFVRTS